MTLFRFLAVLLFAPLFVTLSAPEVLAEAPPFSYEVASQILKGQPVQLTFATEVPLDELKLNVKRKKGKKKFSFKEKNMGSGSTVTFEWEQASGTHTYSLDVTAIGTDGSTWEASTIIEVEVLKELIVEIDLTSVDFKKGEMAFEANRPIAAVELEVFGKGRKLMDDVAMEYGGSNAREEVQWTPGDEVPVLMNIKVYDNNQIWRMIQVFRLEIPHTDITFETDSAEISDEQEPYLAETMAPIKEALETYDDVAIELYIAGFTDTVGGAQYNKELSMKRARSIAKWFRGQGLRVPIYYDGFGESGQAVATEDEVDEPANRRAIYLLTNGAPGSADFPGANWKKL